MKITEITQPSQLQQLRESTDGKFDNDQLRMVVEAATDEAAMSEAIEADLYLKMIAEGKF